MTVTLNCLPVNLFSNDASEPRSEASVLGVCVGWFLSTGVC